MRQILGVIAALSALLSGLSGCSFVSLQQYYARVGPSVPIDVDPIGGYMLLYWIDADGTACHGSPGFSGQPGPAALTVARPAAIQDAIGGALVSSAQLKDDQLVPYTVSDYLKSNAAGYHFFQFDNLLWRLRNHRRSSNDHHKRGAQKEPEAFHVDASLLRRLPAGLDTRTRQEQPCAAVIDPGSWVMRTCTVFLPARATRQSK